MLRRGFLLREKFYFISPLENTFAEFLQGRQVNPSTVAGFISGAQPGIKTISDYVYIHRLATSNMKIFDAHTKTTLVSAIESIDLSTVPVGPLSVLLNCSLDFETTPICERIISEIFSRPQSDLQNSRIISRLIRAMESCPTNSERVSILSSLVDSIDVGELSLEDMLSLIRSTGQKSESVITRLSEIAPLLSSTESVHVLVEVVSGNPSSEIFGSLLSDLKRNILAAETLDPRLIARAITALARIGALTSQFRGLVSKSQLSRLSESEMSILRMALYTANPPTVDDEEKFDPKFLPVISRQKTLDSLINMYSGFAKNGALTDQQMDSLTSQSDSVKNFAQFTMWIELMLLSSRPIDEAKLEEYVSMESQQLLNDPFVKQVMEELGVSELSRMSDSCPLLVVQKNDQFVLDIDSYTNPVTRVMRSKIAENLGLEYRVIDPLSWIASEDKAEYIRNLCDGDSVFACNTPVQSGADTRHDRELPKAPFFGYIRKIDLK
jgi:hypothetical protein